MILTARMSITGGPVTSMHSVPVHPVASVTVTQKVPEPTFGTVKGSVWPETVPFCKPPLPLHTMV